MGEYSCGRQCSFVQKEHNRQEFRRSCCQFVKKKAESRFQVQTGRGRTDEQDTPDVPGDPAKPATGRCTFEQSLCFFFFL